MGYTNRKFEEKEIAILTISHSDHDNERAQAGDIVAIRKPHYVIGTREATNFIWLRIEGLEENEFAQLRSSCFDSDEDHELGLRDNKNIRYDKRRYFIPLDRLKKLIPSFDIDRAKDPSDFYQPFITIDFSESGYYYYLSVGKPLSVHGLVFDKLKGMFL